MSRAILLHERLVPTLTINAPFYSTQVLLALQREVCITILRSALGESLQIQKYQAGGIDCAFPELAILPRKLQATAVRACAPSIDAQLTWSICLTPSDLSRARHIICSALSTITSLTTISFNLSTGKSSDQGTLDSQQRAALDAIIKSICYLPCLSSLFVSESGLGCTVVYHFIRCLPAAQALEVLKLQSDTLSYSAAVCFHNTGHLPELRSLAITVASHLTLATADTLAAAITAVAPNLTGLHLSHPCNSPLLAAYFLTLYAKPLRNRLPLRALTLRHQYPLGSDLPTPGIICGYTAATVQPQLATIARFTALEDLAIYSNTPQPGFGQQLLEHCTALTGLTRLCVSGALTAACAMPFGEFLAARPLQELQVTGTPQQRGGAAAARQRLCELPWRYCAAPLAGMRFLTSLDLSDTCAMAATSGQGLVQALGRLPALAVFKWVTLPARSLSRAIPTRTLQLLAHAIRHVYTLRELHLSDAALALQLASSLHKMRRLRKVVLCGHMPWLHCRRRPRCVMENFAALRDLRLIGCGAPADAMARFAPVLAGMRCLRALVLSYHRLDEEGASKLAAALWPSRPLGEKRSREHAGGGLAQLYLLGLGGCGMDAAKLGALSPALHGLAGCHLQQVMLWGNDAEAAARVAMSLLEANPDLVIDSVAPGLL